MNIEFLRGYTGAILRGVGSFMVDALSLAEKTSDANLKKDIANLGVVVVSIDEETGACVVAHREDAGAITVGLADTINAAISATSAALESDTNVN